MNFGPWGEERAEKRLCCRIDLMGRRSVAMVAPSAAFPIVVGVSRFSARRTVPSVVPVSVPLSVTTVVPVSVPVSITIVVVPVSVSIAITVVPVSVPVVTAPVVVPVSVISTCSAHKKEEG